MKYEIYWGDLTKEAQERLLPINNENDHPIASIFIEDEKDDYINNENAIQK